MTLNIKEEMAENSANEGLTKRFDDVLQKHLLKHKEKLTFDNLELLKELKCKKKEREELGLRLYEIQSKTARQHENFQSLSSQLIELAGKREELQNALESTKKVTCKTQELTEAEQSAVSDVLRQVDTLNIEVFKLLSAKESLKSDVKVLDQANLKSVTDKRNLESEKSRQEDCINHLLQIIERFQEKIATHELHIEAIKKQMCAVQQSQCQVQMECEAVDFERKNLIKQWEGAIKNLHKRDETLANLLQNISDAQKDLVCANSEKKVGEKSLASAEDVNIELNLKLSRMTSTAETILKQLSDCFSDKDSLTGEIIEMKCQIEKLEASIASEMRMKIGKEKEINTQVKSIQAEAYETQELRKKLNELILNRNWTDASSQKVLKQMDDIQNFKTIKEQERVNVDREFLALDLEMDEKQRDILQLVDEIKEVEAFLKVDEKDMRDIRCKLQQGTNVLDKKMILINDVQCQLEAFPCGVSEKASLGAVENETQAAAKELEKKLRTVDELKQLWLKQQKYLMQLSQDKEQSLEEAKILENQLMVYRQRNRRVKENLMGVTNENKDLERKMENLYRQIANLNKTTFEDQSQEVVKKSEAVAVEEEWMIRLKENETKLTEKIQLLEQLKEEQPLLREKIRKQEEDLKRWQQKLKEIKETKATIDAEYKEGEIRVLTERLHKMKVQYSTICQHRGLCAKELERSLNRWDTLLTKSGAIAVDSKSRDVTVIKNGLRRQADTLKKKIKTSELELKSVDGVMKSLSQTKDEVERNIEGKKSFVENLKVMVENNSTTLASLNCEKIMSFEELVICQQQLRLYQDVRNDTYLLNSRSETVLKGEVEKNKQRAAQFTHLLEEMELELKRNSEWCDQCIMSKLENLKWRMKALVNYTGITL